MSKVGIKNRIKEALKIREMTQSELAEKANIDKGQLSSYISGKYKPRQNNIDALSLALNVNEAWLMGFNVPMERDKYEDQKIITYDILRCDVEKLLKQAEYTIVDSDDNDIITIINSKREIVCSLHEYELVGIYQTLIENGNLSVQALITEAASGWKKIDAYFYGKEASDEIYKKLAKNMLRFQGKQKELNEIYLQLSSNNQGRVNSYAKKLYDIQQMDDALALDAANDRGATAEQKKNADDIMHDDSEWE